MNDKPVAKVQSGAVNGAVWKNDGKEGAFFTVTFERIYKDGEEYKNSPSFKANDLPHLIVAGHKAISEIDALQAKLAKSKTR